jgi:hypothetical protein
LLTENAPSPTNFRPLPVTTALSFVQRNAFPPIDIKPPKKDAFLSPEYAKAPQPTSSTPGRSQKESEEHEYKHISPTFRIRADPTTDFNNRQSQNVPRGISVPLKSIKSTANNAFQFRHFPNFASPPTNNDTQTFLRFQQFLSATPSTATIRVDKHDPKIPITFPILLRLF